MEYDEEQPEFLLLSEANLNDKTRDLNLKLKLQRKSKIKIEMFSCIEANKKKITLTEDLQSIQTFKLSHIHSKVTEKPYN